MKAEGGRWRAEGGRAHNRDLTDLRPAMTLFELLLVLVLLVVVGSLAAPLFEGSFSSVRLRRGTDQVLAVWSQARTQAIESGGIYQFRFKPNGNRYRVDLWTSGIEADALEIDEPTAELENTAEEIELADWELETTLPRDIVFNAAESVTRDDLGERAVTRLDQDSTTEWSAPILFFPDGTTSPVSLLLKNGRGLYRRATLRSLTGVARASELLTRDEVERLQSR